MVSLICRTFNVIRHQTAENWTRYRSFQPSDFVLDEIAMDVTNIIIVCKCLCNGPLMKLYCMSLNFRTHLSATTLLLWKNRHWQNMQMSLAVKSIKSQRLSTCDIHIYIYIYIIYTDVINDHSMVYACHANFYKKWKAFRVPSQPSVLSRSATQASNTHCK
jgi:hypothetical protein